MANAIEKVNTIAIADIEKVNTLTDDNIEKLNTLEFTGTPADAHTLISTHTLSSTYELNITSGIDSTYDVYEFVWINVHPSDNNTHLTFQVNAAGQSGFNETIMSTWWWAGHEESDGSTFLNYSAGFDQQQGTAYNNLAIDVGSDSDEATSGSLILYAPSSTTYVKHFLARASLSHSANYAIDNNVAGYINTTAAIDEISFRYDAGGNMDSGVIKMYGIAK